MALLEWRPEFSVGNPSIDHEHEHMIQQINDLYDQLAEPMNAEKVEDVLGGVALFTQGACGDITMHRSGPPFKEVERIGHVLAGEVIATAERIRPSADARLVSEFQRVALESRVLPSPAEADAQLSAAAAAYEQAKARGDTREELLPLANAAGSARRCRAISDTASPRVLSRVEGLGGSSSLSMRWISAYAADRRAWGSWGVVPINSS